MRARLALLVSGIGVDLREIVLRDKAPEFLEASPDGTVPLLVLADGTIICESLDIMLWAMDQADPENWAATRDASLALIETADGPFKTALDGYKYAAQGDTATDHRTVAAGFIDELETRLTGTANLTRAVPGLADAAIAPFVRQFAHVDLDWFSAQDWPQVNRWLSEFKASRRFAAIMGKYPRWQAGDPATKFPEAA